MGERPFALTVRAARVRPAAVAWHRSIFENNVVTRRVIAIALFGASLSSFASCRSETAPSATPQSSTPAAGVNAGTAALGVSSKCFGPFQPGDHATLACVVFVQEATGPASTNVSVYADLSQFGGPANVPTTKCPACGDPPTYDVELRVPAAMAPGVKTFPVWAVDTEGRRADGNASIEITGR